MSVALFAGATTGDCLIGEAIAVAGLVALVKTSAYVARAASLRGLLPSGSVLTELGLSPGIAGLLLGDVSLGLTRFAGETSEDSGFPCGRVESSNVGLRNMRRPSTC
jgi:hypothetical protein